MNDKKEVRILLVEDNEVNQMVELAMLKKMGYTGIVAVNGAEALAKLEAEEFDLVLMDCQMPVMDGYETTQQIRQRNDHKHNIPIIALSAHSQNDDFKRCATSGMNDFIAKPVVMEVLKNKIQQWLDKGDRKSGRIAV